MVNFKINDRELSAAKGTTILAAAEKAGIPIPHLCFLKIGRASCRDRV